MTFAEVFKEVLALVPSGIYMTVDVQARRYSSSSSEIEIDWTIYTEETGHCTAATADAAWTAFREKWQTHCLTTVNAEAIVVLPVRPGPVSVVPAAPLAVEEPVEPFF